VLRYFVRNPHAADSVEGVMRWHLSDGAACELVDQIDGALAWLVEEGFLIKESTLAATRFRLNAARVTAAGRFAAGEAHLEPIAKRSRESTNASPARRTARRVSGRGK
jgi:hypothetical protein